MRVRSAFLVLVAAAVTAGTACSPTREEPSTIPPDTETEAAQTSRPEPTSGQPSASATATSGQSDQQVITVNVANGTVTPPPAPVDVPLGTTVVIEVTTDADDEVHVHGYEETVPVTAGRPARVEVLADIPGQFEVELHGNALLLLTLRVQ